MSLDIKQLENLVHDEADYLDSNRFDDWLDLFAEDGVYWMPRTVGQSDPLNEVSLFYEEKTLLRMRIERLQHPQVHSTSVPFRTSHVIGAVRLIEMNEALKEARLSSRFHMLEYQGGRERHFAGKYTHHIALRDGQLKILMKRVDLVNCEATFEPIEVPV